MLELCSVVDKAECRLTITNDITCLIMTINSKEFMKRSCPFNEVGALIVFTGTHIRIVISLSGAKIIYSLWGGGVSETFAL